MKAEMLARQVVRDLKAHASSRVLQWVPLASIAARLALSDDAPIEDALQHALDKGWIIVEGGDSICLTDDGREWAAGVGRR